VIGAGGFTIGLDDGFHAYTYVDIDPALRQVSEEHFLRQPLSPNKTFVAESARAFLRRNTQTYDVVVLDAFTNRISLPPDLITREAFAAVRQAVAPGGQVVMNIITSPAFADRFSRSIDATIRSVFPFVTRQILPQTQVGSVASVLYLAGRHENEPHDIYTDDRNRSFLDY
jgi:spermidine synthase